LNLSNTLLRVKPNFGTHMLKRTGLWPRNPKPTRNWLPHCFHSIHPAKAVNTLYISAWRSASGPDEKRVLPELVSQTFVVILPTKGRINRRLYLFVEGQASFCKHLQQGNQAFLAISSELGSWSSFCVNSRAARKYTFKLFWPTWIGKRMVEFWFMMATSNRFRIHHVAYVWKTKATFRIKLFYRSNQSNGFPSFNLRSSNDKPRFK